MITYLTITESGYASESYFEGVCTGLIPYFFLYLLSSEINFSTQFVLKHKESPQGLKLESKVVGGQKLSNIHEYRLKCELTLYWKKNDMHTITCLLYHVLFSINKCGMMQFLLKKEKEKKKAKVTITYFSGVAKVSRRKTLLNVLVSCWMKLVYISSNERLHVMNNP